MYNALKQIGRWPLETPKAREEKLHIHIPAEKTLKLIHGKDNQTRVDLFISNEECHVGIHTIPAGKITDTESHDGDEALMILEGRIQISVYENPALEDAVSKGCWLAETGDTFLVPAGLKHQFFNLEKGTARFLFTISPRI
jgi:quercetin dioxygenase-like cupin family protein